MLVTASIVLGGCLSQEDDEEAGSTDLDDTTAQNSPPTISGNPAAAVKVGDNYSFTPNAHDGDGDKLSFSIKRKPAWASFDNKTGELSGRPTLGDIGVYENITVSVSDGQASDSMNAFSVSVDQVGTLSTTLSWTAPTENEDGTALIDLAGYRLYWGTTPGVYTNSLTIDNTGQTTVTVDNLTAGTYEFVATAFNSSGVESSFSNAATRVLP